MIIHEKGLSTRIPLFIWSNIPVICVREAAVVQQAEMYFRVAAFGRLRLRQGDAAQEDAGGGNCETAALARQPVQLQSACLSYSLSSPNLLF